MRTNNTIGRGTTAAALVGLLTGAAIAPGQTRVAAPQFFIWADYPTDPEYDTFSDSYMVKAFRPQIMAPLASPTVAEPWKHPDQVAAWLASRLQSEIYGPNHRLQGKTICVMMQNFGADNQECDAGWDDGAQAPMPEEDWGDRTTGIVTRSVRFYLPDAYPTGDRLPWIREWDTQSDNGHRFPSYRVAALATPHHYRDQEYGFARSYRHPFLRNADPGQNADGSYKAPLRQWMHDFCAAYDALVQQSTEPTKLPSGSEIRWYFDSEPFVLSAGRNGVFMLWELSDPANGMWSGGGAPIVPGTGQTLGQLYDTAHTFFGGPGDLHDSAAGLVFEQDADAARNRGPMRWYSEICQHVHDLVMENCAYQELRDAWGTGVRCGNYNDYAVDGGIDRFGWTQDRPWRADLATSNLDPPPWDPANWGAYPSAEREVFPRLIMDKGRGGPSYFLGSNSYASHWLTLLGKGSGSVGSPSMYRLGMYEYFGRDASVDCPNPPNGCDEFDPANSEPWWTEGGPIPGHRRWNRYGWSGLPWDYVPEETPWDASLRVHRNNAESFLNSLNASGDLAHQPDSLVPWLQMCAATVTYDGPNPVERREASDFTTREETRRLLWVLRSKNISEGLLWTGWWGHNGDPNYESFLDATWQQTRKVLHEVYDPYIDKYAVTIGAQGFPPPAMDPAKLECTLRSCVQVNGQLVCTDKTLDIAGMGQVGAAVLVAEFTVDFVWPTNPWAIDEDYFRILAVLEGGSTAPNTNVSLYAFNNSTGGWAEIYSQDQSVHPVALTTPISNDGLYRTRQHFASPALLQASEMGRYRWERQTDHKIVTRLKVRYERAGGGFTSKTDLVQLALVEAWPTMPVEGAEQQGGMLQYSPGDLNYDGVVDASDVIQFMDDYENIAPPADVNVDDSVDEADVFTFLDIVSNQP